jgi:HK97 family phage portal protein
MARTLFGSLASGFSGAKQRSTSWDTSLWGGAGRSATGLSIDQRTALMATAVMACVSVLSEDVSKMTPQIFERVNAGGRLESGRKVAKNHFLYDLLWRPNDWQTWPEFCRMMMIGYLLRGNAYAVILHNQRGIPYALVPINPDRVQVWQSPDGSLFFLVNRQGLHDAAVLSSLPLLIPYEDVFHLKDLSQNGLFGQSRITLAAEAIALSLGQERQYASIMGNGARPSGYLSTDQKLTQPTAERLKQNWKDVQGGLLNTGGTAVLEQGMKWQALTLTMADLEFLAARNFQVVEICRIFRVPPHMVGDLTRGTFSNVVQGAQEYRNNTLTSHSDIWEKRLDFQFDLREAGLFVDFDEGALLKADIVSRYNVHRIGVLTGIKTQDECRIEEGLAPRGGTADVLLTPSNLVQAGSDATGVAPDGAGKPSNSVGVDNQPSDTSAQI